MGNDKVVLDTDFINGITSYELGDGADLFRRVFCALGKTPVVHPYVADYELYGNKTALKLLDEGVLVRITYCDFLPQNAARHILYHRNFRDIHEIIREEDQQHKKGAGIPPIGAEEDIFARHGRRSYGEVHSILMATELGIPLFYSNDRNARTAARRFARGRLTALNAEEVAKLLEGDTSVVSAKEWKFIGNYYSRNRH